MLDFKRHFPEGKIITFPINYRCSQPIVEAAGRVISKNTKRFSKEISAAEHKMVKERNVLADSKCMEETVQYKAFESKETEYEYLVSELKEIYKQSMQEISGLGNINMRKQDILCNCACLFRTNMDASYLAELLLREKIPYQMKEKPYNPYDHFISRDFLHYLHLKEGNMSMEEFIPVMNRPLRYISRDAIDTADLRNDYKGSVYGWQAKGSGISTVSFDKLKQFYAEKEYMLHNIRKMEYDINRMKKMDIFAAINYVRKGIGYDDFLRKHAVSQNASAEEYLKLADEIQKRMGMFVSLEQLENHIDSYREMMSHTSNSNASIEQCGVHIMTYHASKGLEFDTVFLPDCNEGTIPYRKSSTAEQIEEERRLFYVAMTRAKERLSILYLDGAKGNRHLVSRFVKDAKGGGINI